MLRARGMTPEWGYVPNPFPERVPFMAYVMALEINRRRTREREFLSSHPAYQSVCPCGHRKLAHDDGTGRCLAKKCPCPRFGSTEA